MFTFFCQFDTTFGSPCPYRFGYSAHDKIHF